MQSLRNRFTVDSQFKRAGRESLDRRNGFSVSVLQHRPLGHTIHMGASTEAEFSNFPLVSSTPNRETPDLHFCVDILTL
jgi:hypothetical protein